MVRLACERPDRLGRGLSQWDCAELARQLVADGIVAELSAATVRRLLAAPQLKPWRHHLWLYPKLPRDAGFYATVAALIELYTGWQQRRRCQPPVWSAVSPGEPVMTG